MKRLYHGCFFVLLVQAVLGCALPATDREPQQFVPERDLEVVSHVREGLRYFSSSRFADAVFEFRQALWYAPEAANIQVNLAVALDNLGNHDEASRIFVDLLEENPQSVQFLVGLARVRYGQERFDEARKLYDRALTTLRSREEGDRQSTQRASKVARSLAALSFEVGDEEAALCYSSIAYTLAPGQEEAVRHSKVLLARNLSNKAYEMLAAFTAARTAERTAAVLHQMALAAYGLQRYSEVLRLEELARADAQEGALFEIELEMRVLTTLAEEHVQQQRTKEAEGLVEDGVITGVLSGATSAPAESPSGAVSQAVDAELHSADEGSADEGSADEDEEPLTVEQLEAVQTLYWPANLVNDFHELLETQRVREEAEESSSFWGF